MIVPVFSRPDYKFQANLKIAKYGNIIQKYLIKVNKTITRCCILVAVNLYVHLVIIKRPIEGVFSIVLALIL